MAEQKFFFESMQDTETIKAYLEALIEGIDQGKIVLSTNGEDIILYPEGMLKLTVKARKKEARNRLTIKMQWSDESHKTEDRDKTMAISC